VATQRVRLFILSTNLRIFPALCLYLGFCHAWRVVVKVGVVNNALTWLSSSEGLILENRLKSIMVICRATSSGSKSNIVSSPVVNDDGNYRDTDITVGVVTTPTFTAGGGSRNIFKFFL